MKYCIDCGKPSTNGARLCHVCEYRDNKERYCKYQKNRRENLKAAAYEHYGDCCAYCGSFVDLHIDHKDGNGATHRKEDKAGTGSRIYQWLRNNNYPPGFQTLCRRCNQAKSDMSDEEFRAFVIDLAERFRD